MSRTAKSDPLQGFRFHVKATDHPEFLEYADADVGEAGFQAVTTPEHTSETAEYREGHYTYTRKFPGVPTMNTLTLSRGVYMLDTAFHDWIKQATEGGDYRTDLIIYHWHRSGKVPFKPGELAKGRQYIIHEALPARVKPAADMDSTTGEVSLAEVDVDFEYYDMVTPAVE